MMLFSGLKEINKFYAKNSNKNRDGVY